MPKDALQILYQAIIRGGVVCLAALICVPTAARGDDLVAPTDAPTLEDSSTDDDLFRKLTGGDKNGDKKPGNPLERAIREMRQASKRIVEEDTGETTQGLQQDVVQSLEQLIQQLKQQAQQRSSGNGPSNPQPNEPSAKPEDPMKQDQGPPNDDGKTRDDKSPESTDETRKPEDRRSVPVSSGRMVRDVWGHLPPTLRQKLLNVYEDKYLPQYSELVRRYFESLAEEGRPAPRRK